MSNILNIFTVNILSTLIVGVLLLVIEYWIVQPAKSAAWFEKKSFKGIIRFFAALVSLIVPVLVVRDYLVTFLSRLPAENIIKRLDTYATLLALIATIWGVVWEAFIRPRLLPSLDSGKQ